MICFNHAAASCLKTGLNFVLLAILNFADLALWLILISSSEGSIGFFVIISKLCLKFSLGGKNFEIINLDLPWHSLRKFLTILSSLEWKDTTQRTPPYVWNLLFGFEFSLAEDCWVQAWLNLLWEDCCDFGQGDG